ncbi:MAG TPA: SapC family protein [Pseudoxanthomonas sp.]|nr:SapC family protein [Pseudoxanthomonas sp.]
MPRYELLNNITHKDLRVSTHFGAGFGDQVGMVPAYPTEFAELQREYPIFFRKDSRGSYHAVALLGFAEDENLFLQGDRWLASYLPGAVARGPFLIGFQEQMVDGQLRNEPVIHVDVEHPRLQQGQGQPLFMPHGGHSPYLDYIVTVLRGIDVGVRAGEEMFAALDIAGLIQPMDLEVRVTEDYVAKVTGLHGIDRQALAALGGEALQELHRKGWLEGAYLVLASVNNVSRLIAEKQRRLRAAEGVALPA